MLASRGFSKLPSLDVFAAFKECGLKDIVKEDRSSARHPELVADYRIWGMDVSEAGWLSVAVLHSGRVATKEEADESAERMLRGWHEDYANGAVPFVPVVMVVGRKA